MTTDSDFMEITPDGGEFLKAIFLGEEKTGKTFCAVELAIGTRDFFGLEGPIAGFDTERWTGTRQSRIVEATGKPFLRKRSRSIADARSFIGWCVDNGVSVGIVDSISHLWWGLQQDYLGQANQQRSSEGLQPMERIPISSWGPIKNRWAAFMDAFLNSPIHLILCARAKDEYEVKKGTGGKVEIERTGLLKVAAEKHSANEAHLQIMTTKRMEPGERIEDVKVVQRATVLGDRFHILVGQAADLPTFEFFRPHIEALAPQHHTPMEFTPNQFHVREHDANPREAMEKDAFLGDIRHEMLKAWPSRKADDLLCKGQALEAAFGTGSWPRVEQMTSTQLAGGYQVLKEYVALALDARRGEGDSPDGD